MAQTIVFNAEEVTTCFKKILNELDGARADTTQYRDSIAAITKKTRLTFLDTMLELTDRLNASVGELSAEMQDVVTSTKRYTDQVAEFDADDHGLK